MPTQRTDADPLIRRAREGSGSALGELLGLYHEYLLRIADNRIDSDLRPKLAPSDVVQASLMVATRDFGQFRGESENELRGWLTRIVTSQLVDGLRRFVEAEKRRASREVNHGDSILRRMAGSGESPSRVASLHEDASRLLSTIEQLPEDLRQVVQAKYLEGQTFAQIAKRLKIPVTTCRRRWLEAVETIGRTVGIEP